VVNVEKSSPTLSASFFHWPLIDRQDLSGSFIGRRRMTNQALNAENNAGILRSATKRLLTSARAYANKCLFGLVKLRPGRLKTPPIRALGRNTSFQYRPPIHRRSII